MDMVAFYEGWLGACREMDKAVDFELDKLEKQLHKDSHDMARWRAFLTVRAILTGVRTQPVVPRREPNNDD